MSRGGCTPSATPSTTLCRTSWRGSSAMGGWDVLWPTAQRSCRHRHPDDRRAPAPGERQMSRVARWAAKNSWKKCGNGKLDLAAAGVEQQRRHPRQRRPGQRALHHGRGPVAAPSRRCSCSFTAQNLIYKDKRLVNWDPRLQTAVSDLEVQRIRRKGHALAHPLSGRGPSRRLYPPSPRHAPKPYWAIPPWRCIQTTRATQRAGRQA